MRLQPAVRQETIRIAVGTAALCGVMLAVLAALGRFDHTALLGAVLGWALAAGNFLLLGITVQRAAAADEKRAKNIMQTSYTLRNLLCALGVILGFVVPVFNWVTVILPLFFPRVTILLMQLTGHYKPGSAGDEGGE